MRDFVETTTTLMQAETLVASAMSLAGGFDTPCNRSVPFLAVPGLIMQTVVGQVYPKGFAVAVRTASVPAASVNFARAVSALTQFTGVANSGSGVKIEMRGYARLRAASARVGRRTTLGCEDGKEWRYTLDGAPPEYACRCTANSLHWSMTQTLLH